MRLMQKLRARNNNNSFSLVCMDGSIRGWFVLFILLQTYEEEVASIGDRLSGRGI